MEVDQTPNANSDRWSSRTKWSLAFLAIAVLGLHFFSPCWLPSSAEPPHVIARALWLYGSEETKEYGVISENIDGNTTDDEWQDRGGDPRGMAFTLGRVGFVERHGEYVDKGRGVELSDTLKILRWDLELDYKVPLPNPSVNCLALTKNADRFMLSEFVRVGDNSVESSLFFGDREGIKDTVRLAPNQIVETLQLSEKEDMLLCVVRHFSTADLDDDALVFDTASKKLLHRITLPSGTRYAGWSREPGEIDCLYMDRYGVVFVNIRLSDGRQETILSHRYQGMMGGRFENAGPDGLVRFDVNTRYLPNGEVADSFDGWPHRYVYDTRLRKLYKLNAWLDWSVFLVRQDGEFAKASLRLPARPNP